MRRLGVTFDPFDVVIVPFPFADLNEKKRRPALVVSSVSFNKVHRQTIFAMITSTKNKWPSDVVIEDWQEAGLNVPCKIRLKLFTLDNKSVVRKVGKLSKRDEKSIVATLADSLTTSQQPLDNSDSV
jgi:mRNA interferase MazF